MATTPYTLSAGDFVQVTSGTESGVIQVQRGVIQLIDSDTKPSVGDPGCSFSKDINFTAPMVLWAWSNSAYLVKISRSS